MIGVLGQNSVLLRLYWARDNLGSKTDTTLYKNYTTLDNRCYSTRLILFSKTDTTFQDWYYFPLDWYHFPRLIFSSSNDAAFLHPQYFSHNMNHYYMFLNTNIQNYAVKMILLIDEYTWMKENTQLMNAIAIGVNLRKTYKKIYEKYIHINDWCFRTRSALVRLYWARDNLG